MGCDIHLHVEVKLEDSDQWHHYQSLSVPRNYKLFSYMAGVRNYGDVKPISEPKGLPPDMSAVTAHEAEIWDSDGHSHSWLSAGEITEVTAAMKAELGKDWDESDGFGGYFFGNYYSTFATYPEEAEGITDMRFVFWFDN